MATTFQIGDSVSIVARDTSSADTKSGLYYPHFANLTGSILKIYGEEASIVVDRDSLPEAIRVRHEENEAAERKKYSDRLSESARSGLSDKEKNFPLQYTVLVSVKDIQPAKRVTSRELDAAEDAAIAERSKKK